MHKIKWYAVGLSLCLGLVGGEPASALDGERKGFFIGFGLGGGSLSADQEWTLLGEKFTQDGSAGGAAFNLKIGYGFSNRFILSYSGSGTSGDLETIDGQILGEVSAEETANFGVGGIGLTYFIKDSAPSLFVDVALGASSWDDGDGNSFTGGGISLGGGYEFKKNWTAEVDLSVGSPGDEESIFDELIKAEVTGSAIGFSVNHIWY